MFLFFFLPQFGFNNFFDAIKLGWIIMIACWALFDTGWEVVWVRTWYRGSAAWSLLQWLCLQMASTAEDGSSQNLGILFSFVFSHWEELMTHCPSLLYSLCFHPFIHPLAILLLYLLFSDIYLSFFSTTFIFVNYYSLI